MDSNKKTARTAGVLYLFFVLTFIYSLGYVPSRFYIEGDAAATIKAIQDAELLFRLGIVVGMVACSIYILLLSQLYKLLSRVGKYPAVMMVALGAAHLPLFFSGHVDQLNLLSLLPEGRYEAAFDTEQLHAQVLLLIDAYKNSVRVNVIFMGLWLLPFGYLVFKSGFLPKFLGVLLILNSLPYLIDFFRQMLVPDYTLPSIVRYLLMPGGLGEFAVCLWLLIMGAKEVHSPNKTIEPTL